MATLPNGTMANPSTSYFAAAGAAPGPAVNGILQGMIVMWTGQFVPAGYSLCNGGNGTPDLQNRFIIAAAVPGSPNPQTYPAGTSGGTSNVSLVVNNLPDHQHSGAAVLGSGGTAGINDYNVTGIGGNTGGISSVGYVTPGGAPFDIIPPYYAIAFIMKL